MHVLTLPDVTRDGFVEGQVGEAVFAVEFGCSQIDPEPAWNLAIDRSWPTVSAGSSRFFFRRQSLHFHIRMDCPVEGARHLRANPLQAFLNERHDLGAACIALRK